MIIIVTILFGSFELLTIETSFNLNSLKYTLLLFSLISIGAYIIHIFVKLTLSSYHLARDAEERHQLAHFYLSLINREDNKFDKEDRAVILQALFSRADTGLLKGDHAPTMPNNIIEHLKSLK
jgi:hypothetical protein